MILSINLSLQAPVYFQQVGHKQTPVFELKNLPANVSIEGPAMIIDQTQTLVVAPGAEAKVLQSHIIIDLNTMSTTANLEQPTVVDHIQLSVFGHRFMSIAEQMGRALQKTAVSLNIKERLDFSCALFGPEGMHAPDSIFPRDTLANERNSQVISLRTLHMCLFIWDQ